MIQKNIYQFELEFGTIVDSEEITTNYYDKWIVK